MEPELGFPSSIPKNLNEAELASTLAPDRDANEPARYARIAAIVLVIVLLSAAGCAVAVLLAV